MSTQEKLVDSADTGNPTHQQDGRAANTGKKSKEQDQKAIITKLLKTMADIDEIAIFVDEVFLTIEILCGMIDQSRAAVARSRVEPIVMGATRFIQNIIDLTMLQDADPAKPSRFYLQDLILPLGATVKGKTVKISNNCSNICFTASDATRY